MDKFKIAFKSMFKKPIQTVLTVFSIAIGVAAVLIISLVSTAGKSIIDRELDSLGINGITISIEENGQNIYLNETDLEYIKSLKNVQDVAPIITKNGYIYNDTEQIATLLWGIGSGERQIISLELLHGRLITENDISAKQNVCVIDADTAEKIFYHKNCVGNRLLLSINGFCEYYTVIGVALPNSSILETVSGEFIPSIIYVPYTTLQAKTGSNKISQIAIRLTPAGLETLESSVAGIERAISLKKSTDDVKTSNLAAQRDKLTSIVSTVTVMLSVIGAISLVVAGIGVMTLMLVSVGERKKEIGIKKAIGANRRTILSEFLIESVLLSTIGSFMGLILTGAAAAIASNMFGYAFTIQRAQLLLTMAVSLVCGIIFGVYPAFKASKLKPVETLKSE